MIVLARAIAIAALALNAAACATPRAIPPPLAHHRPPPPRLRPVPPQPAVPSAPARPIPLADLPGWAHEDHAGAYLAWRAGCRAAREPGVAESCARAARLGPLAGSAARAFLEANFQAEALPGEGVLTAYFAPVYPARSEPDTEFSAAVRGKPADLLVIDARRFDPGQSGRPGAARLGADGGQEPYPDRSAIEATSADFPLAWMRPEELFFLQIQGSGLLTLEDGRTLKARFAATNGRSFVGVANPMRDRGLLARDATSGEAIRGWLAAHRGPEADAIMRLNPRYVFFSLTPDDGTPPVGAAGLPLPAGRAIAIDPAFHALGTPFWIVGETPMLAGAFPSYRRLVTALDTGGAIKGEIRADLYLGEGAGAGAEAGRVRHTLRLYRLVAR